MCEICKTDQPGPNFSRFSVFVSLQPALACQIREKLNRLQSIPVDYAGQGAYLYGVNMTSAFQTDVEKLDTTCVDDVNCF